MTIVARVYQFIVGVDTTAGKHAFSIVETRTQTEIDLAEFPVTPAGFARAIPWIRRRTNQDSKILVSMEGPDRLDRP